MKRCVLVLLAAAALAQDRGAWERELAAIRALDDDAAALARIAALDGDLAARDTTDARFRRAELRVRAKVPRLAPMAQGAASLEALGLLDEVLAVVPDHVPALYLKARTSLALPGFFGKREAGIAALARLVDLAAGKPGRVPHPDVFLRYARLRPDDARRALDVGLRSFPAHAELLAARAKLGGAGAEPDPRLAKNARASFRAALAAGTFDYAAVDAALAAGQKLHPEDASFPLDRGLLRLWRLERVADAGAASEAAEFFRTARRLDPDDTRIHGWLGSLLYIAGHAAGAEDVKRAGARELAVGVAVNPEQNRFARALALRRTGGDPKEIAEDLYRTLELCAGGRMDRARFVPPAAKSAHPACGDGAGAPFNLSGTLFWAGEFFRGHGDAVRARDAYTAALRADARKAWPFRALAEERLALLGGGGERPPAAKPASCRLCHQVRRSSRD